jgi:type IV secretion system protein VirB9
MLKKFLLSFSCLICFAGASVAEQAPVGFKSDLRIKRYVYDENNVYKLNLYLKSVTALQFADGENVESILIGDSASWEVVKLKMGNVISLKPIIDDALTNMTVFTDRRVYTFELIAKGEIKAGMAAGADQAFRTRFTYPEDEFTELDKSLAKGGPVSQGYMVSGEAPFRPIRISDNTLQTTFVLPQGAPRPAIFKVGLDREEKLVNSRMDGEKIVVDGTSDYWVMRIGDQMVCVGRAAVIRPSQIAGSSEAGHPPYPKKGKRHVSK